MNKGVSMIDTLRDFVERVDGLGIEYMVTGSYAMAVFGEIRMTRDIDVVVQISDADVKPLYESFKDEYYISDLSIRNALYYRSMFNIVSNSYGGKLDLIIKKNSDFANSSFERRIKVSVDGIDFGTATKEDLIISKHNWAKETMSELQIRDIASLTASEYDSEYVNHWIERLNLHEIWAAVAQWKTLHKR